MTYKKSIIFLLTAMLCGKLYSQNIEQTKNYQLGVHVGESTGINFKWLTKENSSIETSVGMLGVFNQKAYTNLYEHNIGENSKYYNLTIHYLYDLNILRNNKTNLQAGIGFAANMYVNIRNQYPPVPGFSTYDIYDRTYLTAGLSPRITFDYQLTDRVNSFLNFGVYLDLYQKLFWSTFKCNIGFRYRF